MFLTSILIALRNNVCNNTYFFFNHTNKECSIKSKIIFFSFYIYLKFNHKCILLYQVKMLRVILNKSWRQHPTKHQLYGHLPPIRKNIKVRRTRHAGHCWRSGNELISDVFLWTPSHGQAKAGRPARNYIQQLCEDTGCSPKDLPEAMNNKEEWRERVRDIRTGGTTI